MARQRHKDRIVYVVAWEPAGIVKIGYTDCLRRRQRAFIGAQLILTLEFPDLFTGYDFEVETHHLAFQTWPRAFASKEEALPYIGQGGAGFLECYRANPAEALELVASQCLTMPRHSARHDASSQCPVTIPVTIIRTDGRTNGEPKHRDGKNFTAVTRTRASRNFDQSTATVTP